MRTFFLSIGFAFVAAAAAFFVPRTYVPELHWEVAWEHRLAPSGGVFATDSAGVSDGERVLVATPSEFLMLGTEDGRLFRLGLRASQFTASDSFFINQSLDTPRWAVERWDQAGPRFMEAVGVPALQGDILAQLRPDRSLSVTDLASPFDDTGLLPPRTAATGYDLCASCDVPTVVRGDLYGTIELFRWPDGLGEAPRSTEYAFETPPFSPSTPVVYAVKALDHDRLIAVVGLNPQRIVVLAEGADGVLQQSAAFDVPESRAIRSPVVIAEVSGESAVVPLRSRVVVFDATDLTFAMFPAPGVAAVRGGFPHTDAHAIVLSTRDGASVSLIPGNDAESVMWEWVGVEVAGVHEVPQDGLVVFHHEGLFMALRIVS